MKEWIATALGVVGVVVFLFCFHGKQMKSVLKIKMGVDCIWGAHYFLLGAYSAFATNLVAVFRELVFMNNDKKVFRSRLWLWLFLLLFGASSALTWKGVYSLLPAACSCLATISFWQKNVTFARVTAIVNNLLMFSYDLIVGSKMGLVSESLAFLSVLIALYRNRPGKIEKPQSTR